jgi:delta-aminolevulinic acid dehydratase/porphobilinogen synthase
MVDHDKTMMEQLMCIKRAGASLILILLKNSNTFKQIKLTIII